MSRHEHDKAGSTDLIRQEPDPVLYEEARRILQAVVSIPESTITPTTPLDVVAGYTAQQIRDAAKVVGMDIPKTQPGGLSHIEEAWKQTPFGAARLIMERGLLGGGRVTDYYQTIGLSLLQDGWYTFQARFPLIEPEDDIARGLDASYTQHEPPVLINLARARTIDDYRMLFTATRWIFANMLSWKGGEFTMPGQLDNSSLPIPKTTPQLPLP